MSASPQRRLGPLSGLTAVVTGASSGIGRAVALEFASQGADLVLHARANERGLAETATAANQLGAECHNILADFADPDACRDAVEQAWAWRPADAWVQNAGADVLTGEAAGLSFEEKLDLLFRVDVRAAMAICREVGARMRSRERGAIVTVGWDQAEIGMAGDAGEAFAAVKGAVMAFSKSLAKSLAPHVRVNCVAPGWIRTKWGEDAPQYWRERAVRESLAGRWGEPRDVAAAAAFLASPAAAFVNGQVVPVNGGFAAGGVESDHQGPRA